MFGVRAPAGRKLTMLRAWAFIRKYAAIFYAGLIAGLVWLWRRSVGRERAAQAEAKRNADIADANARSAERERKVAEERGKADAEHAAAWAVILREREAIANDQARVEAKAAVDEVAARTEVQATGTSAKVANDWLEERRKRRNH